MSETYDPTSLIAGDYPLAHRKVTIPQGNVLGRGTVLGATNVGTVTSAAKAGGNTGDGTLTVDVAHPARQGAKPGVYKVRFVAAAANNGTFNVTDPDGFNLGNVVMAGGAGAFDNDIKFAVADGGADFAVGDGFDITVAAADSYIKSLAAAEDGSQNPACVLAQDVDATDGPVSASGYFTGEFAAEKLTIGAGHTADSLEAYFRKANINIFIRKVGAVA